MFTGLVEALGTVVSVAGPAHARDLTVREAGIAVELPIGASVAVNGVCLTVTAVSGDAFQFQAGPETLRLTNLATLQPGDRVNLERSLRLGDRLGGHIVQGHVDGVGTIAKRQTTSEERKRPENEDPWEMIWFHCPPALARQMVPKGSIAVDGVSLTLVDVELEGFSVALIPHTLAMTTLGFKKPSDVVNLETDLFAKYIWKYLEQLKPLTPTPIPGGEGRGVRGRKRQTI